MASPTKPLAPLPGPGNTENGREFEAAVERVRRRETNSPRKGFDEQRQSEDHATWAETGADDPELPAPPPPGTWTLFSDE
jgi:hypothetical protein